jgi:hypothetical protein
LTFPHPGLYWIYGNKDDDDDDDNKCRLSSPVESNKSSVTFSIDFNREYFMGMKM